MIYFDRLLCTFLAMTVFAAMIIVVIWSSVFGKQKEILLQNKSFSAAQDAVFRKLKDRSFLDSNYHSFDQLLDRKTSVGYDRKDWIEMLSSAKTDLSIAQISFDIYPSTQLSTDSVQWSIEVGHEEINVKLGLLHEGELLRFLQYINERLTINYEITRMEITRVKKKINKGVANQMQVNITVNFSIQWYSIENLEIPRVPV